MNSIEDTKNDLMSPQRSGWLLGVGQLPLFYRTWQPATDARAAVLITHGLGDHSGRYADLAESLVAEGNAVYALDQRGHGRSAGPRTAGRIVDSVADLSAMVGLIKRDLPGRKVFLVGHSWGGLVTLAYAVRHAHDVDGLILSAPAARPKNASAVQILLGKLLANIAPNTGVATIPYDKVSSDRSVVDAQRQDPLTYQGPIRARMASDTLRAMKDVATGLPTLTLPVLLLHGTDDVIADPSTSRFVHNTIGSQDRTLKLYEGRWHQVFNEPQRESVYADVNTWLNSQRTAKP
ncbi:alpha/beta hydrolase [Mycolicibacterium moriokaense]|uniref:Monoacylglycerol lipase n=1 Tax=Mycolicibacterium moriokaense TaxID=39691 RepID=A0A318HAU7_9MYCO|nr:alpha/beta hydrolase [Mycolicibacterium moriokaense]PXX04373.1 alpha-beta hydrolase superfamily lysophospholipase [Mycolicibacterium moriokaense]